MLLASWQARAWDEYAASVAEGDVMQVDDALLEQLLIFGQALLRTVDDALAADLDLHRLFGDYEAFKERLELLAATAKISGRT